MRDTPPDNRSWDQLFEVLIAWLMSWILRRGVILAGLVSVCECALPRSYRPTPRTSGAFSRRIPGSTVRPGSVCRNPSPAHFAPGSGRGTRSGKRVPCLCHDTRRPRARVLHLRPRLCPLRILSLSGHRDRCFPSRTSLRQLSRRGVRAQDNIPPRSRRSAGRGRRPSRARMPGVRRRYLS